jgi:nicotinamidase-related amidase
VPSPVSTAKSARWYNSPRFRADDPWADLNPATLAVVLIDMINWQAHPDGSSVRGMLEVGLTDEYQYYTERCAKLVVPALVEVVRVARRVGATVVHARLASEQADFSDIVPAFQPYMTLNQANEGSWATQPLDELSPAPTDLSVVKRGSGAFVSSDLHEQLSARGITTLVLAGVVTNACVFLTAGAGFDLGYRQYLLSDGTAAFSEADQASAEKFMDSYVAQVVRSSDLIAALERIAAGV